MVAVLELELKFASYIHIVKIVSSVSARELKCPSSARLSSELHSSAWLEPENSSLGSSLFFRFLEKQTQDEVRRAKERLDAVKQKEVNVDQNLSEHEQMLEVWSFMLDWENVNKKSKIEIKINPILLNEISSEHTFFFIFWLFVKQFCFWNYFLYPYVICREIFSKKYW